MSKKVIINVVFLVIMAITGTALARDTYDYAGSCPQSPDKADKWNFYTCECTSYSADKMNEHSVKLTNYYKSVHWGNASNWINAAKSARISYNSSPKHRDIAWWPAGSGAMKWGHVAYVESVDSKGNITVSEYNFGKKYDYGNRSIKKGSSSYPKYFIHFGAK